MYPRNLFLSAIFRIHGAYARSSKPERTEPHIPVQRLTGEENRKEKQYRAIHNAYLSFV